MVRQLTFDVVRYRSANIAVCRQEPGVAVVGSQEALKRFFDLVGGELLGAHVFDADSRVTFYRKDVS